jgi:hypothetical protein
MKHRRGADVVRIGILSWAAFVLGHNLIFLLTYGPSYDAALARTGHGAHWSITVTVVAGLAVALAIGCVARLQALARQARELEPSDGGLMGGGPSDLGKAILRAWLVIAGLTLAIFVLNENVERLAAGLGLPGLAVLDSLGYIGSVAVLVGTSLLVAVLEGLYRWRRDVLIARVRVAAARHGRAALAVLPLLPWVERRHAAISGYRITGRAPPLTAPN